MNIKTKKMIAKEGLIIISLYLIWGAIVAISRLHTKIDNDALIPCLLCLPPLSVYTMYIIIIRFIMWAIKVLKAK